MAKKKTKKKSKKNKSNMMVGSTVVGLIMLWLILPVIAGLFKIGEPDGPRIYPASMHRAIYSLGHRAAGRGEAHSSLSSTFYTRPWFYGMTPKPLAQEKGEQFKKWFNDQIN